MAGNRWLMLAVLFLARTAMALQFQTVASVRPFLMDALAIDFASFGALIGLYMLPGVAIALPGGMLGQRFGAKRVVLAGLALMALGGVVMGLSASFAAAAAGRLISGTGAVLLTVQVAKMVTDWFAGREIVTAMAISIASWPFGTGGWSRGVRAACRQRRLERDHASRGAGCTRRLCAGRADLSRPTGYVRSAPARFALNLTRREWVLVLIAGVMWGLFNVAYIVLISFAPELFTVRGWSLAGGKQHRQPDRLGADPLRSALGVPHRAVRAADSVHGRRLRDHVRGADRACRSPTRRLWRSRSSRSRSGCRPA
jgi:hypothetical protein